MKLSRTVAYALQATLQLAECETGEPVPCSKLAAEGAMPERFLLQILRSLVTHGILHSTRGVEGGYTLERSPNDISVLQIIEAVDGPMDSKLPFDGDVANACQARLREALYTVAAMARRQLQEIKLADLLSSTARQPQLAG
jgi:Rrf2 family protein